MCEIRDHTGKLSPMHFMGSHNTFNAPQTPSKKTENNRHLLTGVVVEIVGVVFVYVKSV